MTNTAEDHLAILNVLHGYTFAVDAKDVAGIRASFHPDARIAAFGNEFSVDEYCDGIHKMITKMVSVHTISNEYVVIDGDTATVKSNVFAYHRVPPDDQNPGSDAIFGR